jgi:hypothetical protein
MAARKRHCKRESPSDTDDDESDKAFRDIEAFLVETMRELIARSGADVDSYLRGDMGVKPLANIVIDRLVEKWDGPGADHGNMSQEAREEVQGLEEGGDEGEDKGELGSWWKQVSVRGREEVGFQRV